ncbi:MAG TPA: ABC transporter ATP-binding protein [candidate division Zixibacteria bacterium]|nr:ABC transporter ATP-binding protein [candidate division Zixibacteria bacterium]
MTTPATGMAMPETPAIEAIDLVRTYRTHTGVLRRKRLDVPAVKGVSFEVRPGELFGLLGPNGAGKTTTIKMLITLLLPTAGTARVMGHDVVRETTEVRRHIGYVFGGDRGLYDRVSGMDNLRYFAELYGVDPAHQKRRIAELLDLVGLTGREHEKVEGYSRGMRQRLHVARGLLHDPRVVFLDEPSIGLDPVGARELRQTIKSLVDAGKTVLLTTHYMFEADALCDRIAVINDGRIVALGTGADLKAAVANRTIVEIETFGVAPEAVEALRADPEVIAVNMEERDQSQILLVQSERGTQITQRLLNRLGDTRVGKVVGREPTLEDAYVHLIATTSGGDGSAARAAAVSV